MSEQTTEAYQGWSVLELFGHRKLGGYITEEDHFGARMCRIDIPGPDDTTTTQYYGGSAIYGLTPTTEDIARAVAQRNQPAPVSAWELRPQEPPRALTAGRVHVTEDAGYYGPDDDDTDDDTDEIGL